VEVQSVELTVDRGTTATISDVKLADVDAEVNDMDMLPIKGEKVQNTFGDLVGWLILIILIDVRV